MTSKDAWNQEQALEIAIMNGELERGAKETAGKPRYSLLPRKGCLAVIEVREYGTQKYHGDSENWRKVPEKEWAEAAVRHLMSYLSGEQRDPESGMNHLAHAACSCLLGCSVEPTAKGE